jgi:DNA ligase (NAD+)
MPEESLEEARTRLRRYQEAYYNLEPLVPDSEYDALVEWVRQQDPNAPELKKVGAPVPTHSVWEKVAHDIPMGSLSKANNEAEFLEWAGKLSAETWFITHKIDGSSMELVYKAGKLIRCVTRGDGMIGEDVTANIAQVPSVPKELPVKVDVTVRGEIVMFKDVFKEKYAEEYANPRNTAAGKVRQKKDGGESCQDLEFLAYWMKMGNHLDQPKTMHVTFMWLQNHGFKTPAGLASAELDAIKSHFAQTAKERDAVPYEIDGMVVSVNSLELMEELGDLNMRPRGQIAWKFEALMGITRMVAVKWQVGPSGRVTPVAEVEPVEVGGVTITSVSLHNLSIFRDLKLWKGCRVLVSRRNDVIPYIEKNLDLEAA